MKLIFEAIGALTVIILGVIAAIIAAFLVFMFWPWAIAVGLSFYAQEKKAADLEAIGISVITFLVCLFGLYWAVYYTLPFLLGLLSW